jgi:hypothetical protein
MNWRHMMKRSVFAFEADVVDARGNKYNTLVRELQPEDRDRLAGIVRNYSENATLLLYRAYCGGKEQLIRDIGDERLNKTLDAFGKIGRQYSGDMQSAQQDIRGLSDEQLFSPYGPIQAPFAESVEKYINRAIDERNKPDRDTFRLGIEVNGRLIGGFVFDFIEKTIEGYRTIGDIGVYTEKAITARLGWRYAVYPVMYFINSVVKEGYEDKGENLYISSTTHRCNFETQRMLGNEKGFIELGGNIPSAYGHRRTLVCKYTDFVNNFLPRPESLRIKITNILVNGEINWEEVL